MVRGVVVKYGGLWWLNCGFSVSLVYVDLAMPKCVWLIRWRC